MNSHPSTETTKCQRPSRIPISTRIDIDFLRHLQGSLAPRAAPIFSHRFPFAPSSPVASANETLHPHSRICMTSTPRCEKGTSEMKHNLSCVGSVRTGAPLFPLEGSRKLQARCKSLPNSKRYRRCMPFIGLFLHHFRQSILPLYFLAHRRIGPTLPGVIFVATELGLLILAL